jgi:hypothetical protein
VTLSEWLVASGSAAVIAAIYWWFFAFDGSGQGAADRGSRSEQDRRAGDELGKRDGATPLSG